MTEESNPNRKPPRAPATARAITFLLVLGVPTFFGFADAVIVLCRSIAASCVDCST
jgi:hypothetical protein